MAIILEGAKDHPLAAEVMVVDDQPTSRVVLETILRSIGDNIRVTGYDHPLTALQALESGRLPDLIVADYRMPGIDGIAFTRGIRQTPSCSDIPLVIVTVVEQRSVMYEALEAGATDFLIKPVDHYECKVRCRNLLTMRRQQLIIRNRASALEARIQKSAGEMRARERETLERLARTGEYHDSGAGLHQQCMGRLARRIAGQLGLPGAFCDTIELAAPLHDIGNIGVPSVILQKPGPLTDEETRIMRTHTRIGYEILKESTSPYLQMGATIALQHHEAFDGTGYPEGLAGEAIALDARIVAVVDTFDAMCRPRSYKPGLPVADALAETRGQRGRRLDPACVDALLQCIEHVVPKDPEALACRP